jgi:hypothetical protein
MNKYANLEGNKLVNESFGGDFWLLVRPAELIDSGIASFAWFLTVLISNDDNSQLLPSDEALYNASNKFISGLSAVL